jgi:hypothetical protein
MAVKYSLNNIFLISRGGLKGSNIPDRRKSYLSVCAGRRKLPQIVQIGIASVIPRRALGGLSGGGILAIIHWFMLANAAPKGLARPPRTFGCV